MMALLHVTTDAHAHPEVIALTLIAAITLTFFAVRKRRS